MIHTLHGIGCITKSWASIERMTAIVWRGTGSYFWPYWPRKGEKNGGGGGASILLIPAVQVQVKLPSPPKGHMGRWISEYLMKGRGREKPNLLKEEPCL